MTTKRLQEPELLEGVSRLILEMQARYKKITGRHLAKPKAKALVEGMIDDMFDELFKNHGFNFAKGHGILRLERKVKKLDPEKVYSRWKPNTHDGNYAYHRIRFEVGYKDRDRLRYLNDGVSVQPNDSPFDTLQLFTDEE